MYCIVYKYIVACKFRNHLDLVINPMSYVVFLKP